jgi:hypothetical protein
LAFATATTVPVIVASTLTLTAELEADCHTLRPLPDPLPLGPRLGRHRHLVVVSPGSYHRVPA